MIKNVAYFPLQCALNSAPVMQAVLQSLKSAGMSIAENSMTADAAIIWSVLWAGRMQANRTVYKHYRSQNKPVIIVEVGALHRGTTWKIAVNNITAQGYYGHTDNLDWDRPRKLNIQLQTPTKPEPHIVIAAQHHNSLQVANLVSVSTWVQDTINNLKLCTDRPIVVRPHPRSTLGNITGASLQQPKKLAGTYDSFDMDFNCHAVINFNSGPGVQAAIAGVRPVVDASSLAAPVSIDIANIEQPYTVDRDLWLAQICHTEYLLEEIKQGSWIKRILPALQV